MEELDPNGLGYIEVNFFLFNHNVKKKKYYFIFLKQGITFELSLNSIDIQLRNAVARRSWPVSTNQHNNQQQELKPDAEPEPETYSGTQPAEAVVPKNKIFHGRQLEESLGDGSLA